MLCDLDSDGLDLCDAHVWCHLLVRNFNFYVNSGSALQHFEVSS